MVKIPEQIANPSYGHAVFIQYCVRPKIHPTEKVQRVSSYSDSVGTSSVQSQNQRYAENREKQKKTYVPRKFYGQVTYSIQKQAYTFLENDAVVPIENSMDVIYQNPTKRSFKYDKKQNRYNKLVYMNMN